MRYNYLITLLDPIHAVPIYTVYEKDYQFPDNKQFANFIN